MNSKLEIKNAKWRAGRSAVLVFNFAFFILNSVAAEGTNRTQVTKPVAVTNGLASTNVAALPQTREREPRTARDFFNAGVRRLRENKLGEAESRLQTALAQDDERVWPGALYNLGHVRYAQGAEELKKSPESNATIRRAEAALDRGTTVEGQLRDGLVSEDLRQMVGAYLNGRGARRELKEAMDLTRRALEAHGVTLQKWQRARNDFQSTLELNPDDADARRNVAIIEEQIAKLIDRMRQMAQLAQQMAGQRQGLGELMRQLRGKIPAPDAPPGAAEDYDAEEDDDDQPRGPKPGQEESRGREGEERRPMSREEAGWLLDALKLGGDRRLPMGQGGEKQSPERKGRTW
jgi:tetratricopeptide (TPR) repeat protein